MYMQFCFLFQVYFHCFLELPFYRFITVMMRNHAMLVVIYIELNHDISVVCLSLQDDPNENLCWQPARDMQTTRFVRVV